MARCIDLLNALFCFFRILGTSGQPVDDVRRYSDIDDPLEILEKTLEWGHIAPTAPDTLGERIYIYRL